MKSGKENHNRAVSVRARLLQLARMRQTEFQNVLSDFAIERLLYRLGASEYASRFVLKGAMLFKFWPSEGGRATWDLDLLGRGFGDSITPPPILRRYPTLLDHAAPAILTYPLETVVAEKLEALVSLGLANTRMKDYFDLHMLASDFGFEAATLVKSIRATFQRRGTPLPTEVPLVLTEPVITSADRQRQWMAFLRRGRLKGPLDLGNLMRTLQKFLLPMLAAAAQGSQASGMWPPGGPWVAGSTRSD